MGIIQSCESLNRTKDGRRAYLLSFCLSWNIQLTLPLDVYASGSWLFRLRPGLTPPAPLVPWPLDPNWITPTAFLVLQLLTAYVKTLWPQQLHEATPMITLGLLNDRSLNCASPLIHRLFYSMINIFSFPYDFFHIFFSLTSLQKYSM